MFAILPILTLFKLFPIAFDRLTDAVCEVNDVADSQPNGESDPRVDVQLKHQIDIHKNAKQRQQRNERHLNIQFKVAGWLKYDDEAGYEHRHNHQYQANVYGWKGAKCPINEHTKNARKHSERYNGQICYGRR